MEPGRYVRALLREREGYVMRGQADRVADVDAELARFEVVVEQPPALPPARPGPETTSVPRPPETATPPRPRRPGR